MQEKPGSKHDFQNAHNGCVQRILRIHHLAVVRSGEEREKGLEDKGLAEV